MYIDPFWCGVISVMLAESVLCAIIILKATRANFHADEEEED